VSRAGGVGVEPPSPGLQKRHVLRSQLQLPSSRRPLRPGGDFSSRSARWPPVTSCEAPGPARIAPLCGSSQAAPGFPECPEEDSNLLVPTWRAGRAAATKKTAPWPPSARTVGVVTAVRYVSVAPDDGLREAYAGMRRRRRDVSTTCCCASLYNGSSFARYALAGMYCVSACFTVSAPRTTKGGPVFPGRPRPEPYVARAS
jgi:hypothetical protein